MSRRVPVAVFVIAALVTMGGQAGAAWGVSDAGSGFAQARQMPSGNTPSAAVSGRNVTVSWAASTFPGGVAVSGYSVRRYGPGDTEASVGNDCSGTLSTLSCTERGVPSGTWRYTVTPNQGNWTGAESTKSAAVAVGSPTLTLSPSNPTLSSLPATLSGSIANFVDAETIRFRLDSATGTMLSGTVAGNATPAPVPSGGTASVTVTIPAGTTDGAHSVYAVASPSGESASASFTVDGPPLLTGLEMFDINANGKVDRVIATFSENIVCTSPCLTPWTLANVPSGGVLGSVSTATNKATLTIVEGVGARDTAVGSFTVALAPSAIGIRDAGGNQSSFSATAPTDKAAPVPVSISDTNIGTDGKMEAGDTLTVTFSEVLAPGSVPGSASVTETDPLGSGNDTLTIAGMSNGALTLGGNNYIRDDGTSASFASSNVALTGASKAITVTVAGSCSGTCGANITAGNGTFVFAPAATIADPAGNAAAGSTSLSLRVF
jgi:hypothetical protein